ncbi:MAG: 4-(cytidine 5'-diphospho)-2-C-methyl-D-erythritol kinase, partial [Planctomycetaceae bacterium]|nr:4-(cytidine 5'-diphospho)-2-C-methyl-D-erythritol kinase [Planctomycetaceae bacterium]
ARAVGMSGSGPTVFGVFDDLDAARAAAAGIPWQPTDRVHVGRTAGSP